MKHFQICIQNLNSHKHRLLKYLYYNDTYNLYHTYYDDLYDSYELQIFELIDAVLETYISDIVDKEIIR